MTDNDDILTITHSASGASFAVHKFGATVISYKSADGRENLFLSSTAKLDGSKAIRGGIPQVFPIFGPPTDAGSTMPQHGFARQNMWTVKEGSQHDSAEHAGIALTLNLADASAGRGENNTWSVDNAKKDGTDCRLTLDIKVDSASLTTILIVENTGSDAFNFNCLQHTYFAVDGNAAQDPTKCYVHGLGGYSVIDKVDSANDGKVASHDEDIDLTPGEVDRVYVHPEEKHSSLSVKIGVGGGGEGEGKTVKMEAMGEIDESPVPVSCVVWNPYIEKAKAMGDFTDEQYKEMICVEPGLLGHQPVLNPGKEARFTQIIFA
eukprot:CAMPEP_0197726886 /NCGR_PEP_ID=MMETSP1434-20131217/17556_1 /TAXON_ID=265543 /ORGANISM="Minutocellus polymorphus, Strain CCMP3303" /LENGTH=319 /DNA_ID=CAMNT_0043312935 /DNA_START=45 /DNA_END=1004 /DNA_ORIENTATION=+